MKVLITGVAGLLGSHFSSHLLKKGYNVVGVDDLSGGYKEFIPKGVKFYQLNLIEHERLEEVFVNERPDYVFHFAAYAAEGLSPYIRRFNYQNNIICSINLINFSIKYEVKKFIFTSSMAVYGFGEPPFTEEQTPSPIDPYGIAKFAVEQDLKEAYDKFGLDYTIIRPHNIIGINQNIWDKYRNVIGIWIRKILNKEPISIYGDGTQTRAFSDVQFYMDPFEKVMHGFGDNAFNIGADKEYEIIEAAKILQKVANNHGFSASIKHYEPRTEVKFAFCNHGKAKNLLNLDDKTDIVKTIEDMFIWATEQPNRDVKYIDYEIEKNMYSFWKKQ